MKNSFRYSISFFVFFLLSLSAAAMDLQEAKAKGLVGEVANGYLASPKENPDADIRALIQDVNAKRKSKYQELAKAQGVPLSTIEKLAAEKTFEKTASGHYIKVSGVGWVKK